MWDQDRGSEAEGGPTRGAQTHTHRHTHTDTHSLVWVAEGTQRKGT